MEAAHAHNDRHGSAHRSTRIRQQRGRTWAPLGACHPGAQRTPRRRSRARTGPAAPRCPAGPARCRSTCRTPGPRRSPWWGAARAGWTSCRGASLGPASGTRRGRVSRAAAARSRQQRLTLSAKWWYSFVSCSWLTFSNRVMSASNDRTCSDQRALAEKGERRPAASYTPPDARRCWPRTCSPVTATPMPPAAAFLRRSRRICLPINSARGTWSPHPTRDSWGHTLARTSSRAGATTRAHQVELNETRQR